MNKQDQVSGPKTDTVAKPTGVLTITVTQFRSLGAITALQATLSDWTGFHMPANLPMPQPPPTLDLKSDNVVICSDYPVRLIYNLPDPRYLLVGIAWKADVSPSVGERTFPDVVVLRNCNVPTPYEPHVTGGSCLTVTDNAQEPGNYQYVVLIQEVSTGEIGFYDPGMDNNPNR
ncbi:MAG TPA: hypothetical protein VHE13_00940 [Opitutus sp.]|nr:hypothetical protein [Opitutus sp.]